MNVRNVLILRVKQPNNSVMFKLPNIIGGFQTYIACSSSILITQDLWKSTVIMFLALYLKTYVESK